MDFTGCFVILLSENVFSSNLLKADPQQHKSLFNLMYISMENNSMYSRKIRKNTNKYKVHGSPEFLYLFPLKP